MPNESAYKGVEKELDNLRQAEKELTEILSNVRPQLI